MVKLRFLKSPFRGSTSTANNSVSRDFVGHSHNNAEEDTRDQHRQDEANTETRSISVGAGGGVIRVAPPPGERTIVPDETSTPSSLVTVPTSTPPRSSSRLNTAPGSRSEFWTPTQRNSASATTTEAANAIASATGGREHLISSARATRESSRSVISRSQRRQQQRHPLEALEDNNDGGTERRLSLRRILLSSSSKKKRQTSQQISQSQRPDNPTGGVYDRRSISGIIDTSRSEGGGSGISSTLRRAKSAVAHTFSMSQSPSPPMRGEASSSLRVEADSFVSSVVGDQDYDTEEGMDADSTMGEAVGYTPSEEENIILYPNSGTYYGHAAVAGKAKIGHLDGNAMDCDNLSKNIMEWMKDEAPRDVMPKILSFCGSRRMNALSKVNRAWNAIVTDESVWRVMCEDLHKWVEGDQIPSSWRRYYCENPCVPIDYDSVDAAFNSISSGPRVEVEYNSVRHAYREQRHNARLLLYPGSYYLREALVINCIGASKVSIETISGFNDPEHGTTWCRNYHSNESIQASSSASPRSTRDGLKRSSANSLRQIFKCRSASAAVEQSSPESSESEELEVRSTISSVPGHFSQGRTTPSFVQDEDCTSTTLLVLESRRQNEPVIRVRQGKCDLRGLKVLHYCAGTDIWNGNAAIQVQSPFGDNDMPIRFEHPSVAPTATLSNCDIMSMSGRGYVNIDGGISFLDRCNIHNSAATGIYIGGIGSVATILRTDIFENGNGNERNRRGVARGHSGVYVEQGITTIRDSNISKNSLTGISAVSSNHATLELEGSDIVSNGSVQLEMPPIGSTSRGRSYSRNNNISTTGRGRPRSLFLSGASERGQRSGPVGGHFPPIPQSPSEFPNDSVIEGARARRGNVAVA